MTTPLMSYLDLYGFTDSPLGGGFTGKALDMPAAARRIVVTDLEGFGFPDTLADGWLIRVFDTRKDDYDQALIESLNSDDYAFSGPCLALAKAIGRHEVQGRTLSEKLLCQNVAKMWDNGATPQALAKAFADGLRRTLTPDQWRDMTARNATVAYDGGACASHDFCDANLVMMDAFAAFGIDAVGDSDAPAGSPEDYRRAALAVHWGDAWAIAKRDYLTASEGESA